jgi:hypothetical protein
MKITIFLLLFSNLLLAGQKAIYGKDHREDWYQIQDIKLQEIAKSTAALINNSDIINQGNFSIISSPSLRGLGYCPDEKFVQQITAAKCTGFLISENLMLTSANCIKTLKDCEESSWVFDYRLKFKQDKGNVISNDSIYKCIEIIERKSDILTQNNFALIKLERNVYDRAPLQIRKNKSVKKGTSLYSIGHSFGLPTKIIENAKVIKSLDKFFIANIDSGFGSSGSPVINSKDHVVEGILVQNQLDTINQRGCKTMYELNDSRGESITYTANIISITSH